MAVVMLFWHILVWHYVVAPIEIIKITRDFLWFLYHFFSIRLLLRTLFSKWKRIGEVRHRRLSPSDFLSTHFINLITRVIGFFIRSLTIIIGFTSMAILLVAAGTVLFVWLLYPVVVVGLFVIGWNLLVGSGSTFLLS